MLFHHGVRELEGAQRPHDVCPIWPQPVLSPRYDGPLPEPDLARCTPNYPLAGIELCVLSSGLGLEGQPGIDTRIFRTLPRQDNDAINRGRGGRHSEEIQAIGVIYSATIALTPYVTSNDKRQSGADPHQRRMKSFVSGIWPISL